MSSMENAAVAEAPAKTKACGQKTQIVARVNGYYRPVDAWNEGKKSEFKDRKMFSVHTAPASVATAVA